MIHLIFELSTVWWQHSQKEEAARLPSRHLLSLQLSVTSKVGQCDLSLGSEYPEQESLEKVGMGLWLAVYLKSEIAFGQSEIPSTNL